MQALPHGVRQALPFGAQFLGNDQGIECPVAHLFGRIAEQAGEFAVDARHPLLEIEHDNRFGCALEQFVEKCCLHPQLLFGALAATKVAQNQPHQRDDAQAKQRRAHRAVHDLHVPGIEHGGFLHTDTDRERIAADGLRRVYSFHTVGRAS